MKNQKVLLLCMFALLVAPVFAGGGGDKNAKASGGAYPASGNFPAAGGDSQIVVYPVNKAIVLAGSTLDFKVEVNGISDDVSNWNITINGANVNQVFGKDGTTGDTKTGKYIIWEGVSFNTPADVAVTVQASGSGFSYNKTVRYEVYAAGRKAAKNVILLIGDGMGQSVKTAARIVAYNLVEGRYNGFLHMDQMDIMTAVTTSGLNSLVTDSANSASAYATGHKTSNNAMGVYTLDPRDNTQKAAKVENIVELAKRAGMSTGLVTTSEITDATPSAMFAHTIQRSQMQNIVDQMYNSSQRPDVILGGAAAWFWPQSTTGSRRNDDTDMIAQFEGAGYTFVGNATELNAVNTKTTNQLLGLFHPGNLNVYIDKAIQKDPNVLGAYPDQPVLDVMTEKAIEILSRNKDGFFLMVEGASIDKQLHAMDWERAIWDTIEFDKAIGVAKRFADISKDTLIIVVGDHSHSFSVYGTVDTSIPGREGVRLYEAAEFPTYTHSNGYGFPDVIEPSISLAIGWGNHPDYYEDWRFQQVQTAPSVIQNGVATANPVGRAPGAILRLGNMPTNTNTEVHAADDVTLTAYGAGSHYFNKTTIDNTEVFRAIVNALGLDPRRLK